MGVEISNRPNKVRVSKNRENHVFEYIVLEYVESSGEQPPTLRKMFRGHLGVENSVIHWCGGAPAPEKNRKSEKIACDGSYVLIMVHGEMLRRF